MIRFMDAAVRQIEDFKTSWIYHFCYCQHDRYQEVDMKHVEIFASRPDQMHSNFHLVSYTYTPFQASFDGFLKRVLACHPRSFILKVRD